MYLHSYFKPMLFKLRQQNGLSVCRHYLVSFLITRCDRLMVPHLMYFVKFFMSLSSFHCLLKDRWALTNTQQYIFNHMTWTPVTVVTLCSENMMLFTIHMHCMGTIESTWFVYHLERRLSLRFCQYSNTLNKLVMISRFFIDFYLLEALEHIWFILVAPHYNQYYL